ncbi:MAG: helix-turn-helix domain-containing protein [Alicyclobacillus sp.]|nr:helix-turn-helix domain-containing protein [Alicyclobacillus sp.]
MPAQRPEDLPICLTPEEARALLRIGRTRMYELCHDPSFPCFRIGSRILIPRDRLLRWLDAHLSGGGESYGRLVGGESPVHGKTP